MASSNRERHATLLIVGTTVAVGIVPIVAMAWWQGTLFLTSRVDGPLLAVPSVWIGDSLLLPLFNLRVFRFFRSAARSANQGRGHWFWSFVLASCITGYSHYEWTQDAFSGFIDPTRGMLSLPGWWHLFFTIAEMTLVFSFVWSWLRAVAKGDSTAEKQGSRAWRVFLWYALLSVADFVVLHAFLLPRRGVADYTWSTAWEGLLVVPFWLVIGLFAVARSRNRQSVPKGEASNL